MTTVPPDDDPEGEPDWVDVGFGAAIIGGAFLYAKFKGWWP